MKKILFLSGIFLSMVLVLSVISAGVITPSEDSDNDGVLDSEDICPETPLGEIVDNHGCSISQMCVMTGNYKNHGHYVSCVAHVSEDFLEQGLITLEQKDLLVSQAAQSSIGKN